MKIRTRTNKRARIEIIPMIDVIFFLLVFFMISSMAVSKTYQIPVNLPKTTQSAQSKTPQTPFILTLKKDGTLYLNSTSTNLEKLGALLSYEMRNSPEESVVVKADQGVNYGAVVSIMEAAKKTGVRKFSLATEHETQLTPHVHKM